MTDSSVRALLRRAIDRSGFKDAAVAAHMEITAPHLSKLLSGEKPIGARHIDALPYEVRVALAIEYGEALNMLVMSRPTERETRDLEVRLAAALGVRV